MPFILAFALIAGFLIGVISANFDQNVKWKNKIIEGTVVVEEPEYAPPVVYSCKLLTTQEGES
jgi:hypothetical protein